MSRACPIIIYLSKVIVRQGDGLVFKGATLYILVLIAIVFAAAAATFGYNTLVYSNPDSLSRSNWESASPFAITSSSLKGGHYSIELRNTAQHKLYLHSFALDMVDILGNRTEFEPGESITLNGSVPGFECRGGSRYMFSSVKFYYSDEQGKGLIEEGSALSGNCG